MGQYMPANCLVRTNTREAGFTLIELVVGIVVFTISLSIILTLIVPQAEQTAEPLRQVKAAKLGQSLMNEVLSRSYDENSDRSPPFKTCTEKGNCTTSLGAEEGSREAFDDVDDYHGINISDAGGIYAGYGYTIAVEYDSSVDALGSANTYKRIDIVVIAPNNQSYAFSAYRGSY